MRNHTYLSTALLALAASASPLHAQLLLTEINSNGGVGDFWELTNVGAGAVDIGNYRWTDLTGGNTFAMGSNTIPTNTTIASGESIIFTLATESAFRTWWGASLPGTVKVFSSGGEPGLGSSDGVTLYNSSGSTVFAFSYGANGFTRLGGTASLGGHAGPSARPTGTTYPNATSMVWVSASGTSAPQYTAADGTTQGTFSPATGSDNKGSPGYSGFDATPPSVTLTLAASPDSFSESAANPASVGTVTRSVSSTSELVVTLSSSDPTEATVPATVTIPANQTSANFDITAVDDSFPDGSKTATISATATDVTAGTVDLTVADDGDVLDTSLMLTELQSNQSSGAPSTAEDYWELTNTGSTIKDISGYSWHDSGRSGGSAAAYKLPPGTMIAPGESVIFSEMPAPDFRAWWNVSESVQVFQSVGAPGLGKGDGVSFFDEGQNELFFFSYAVGDFTLENGDPSIGENPSDPNDVTDPGHAGIAAGGAEASQAIVWVPGSGSATPRYTAATGTNYGTFSAVSPATDLGSPGSTFGVANVSIASASIEEGDSGTSILALDVTRSDVDTAFTVDYAVTGGTADNADFSLAAGSLSFPASGPAVLPINITVNGDTDSEPDETVIVTLSNLVNTVGDTVLGTAMGTGTILNDEPVGSTFSMQPVSTTITGGSATTLSVTVSGSPTPTIQWYQGVSGDISTPVGTDSTSFITPALTETTSYWARATNIAGTVDSDTVTVTVTNGVVSVDLASYIRVGRYNLPEPTRTALPAGTASHNLLCQEASAVTYNWDTDTLFVSCDGGRSITQVSKTGQLIDTMSLDLKSGAPQGTEFYDPEGITYIGNGEFVFSEERDQQLVKFTYVAGTTLTRAATKTVDLGPFDDNTGTEGLTWDPPSSDFICLKEKNPIGVFRTGVDFNAGTATTAPPTTGDQSSNLFDTSLLGMTDTADVFAFTNIPTMAGQAQAANLLILGQEDAKVVNVSRTGVISSTLNITADAGDTISSSNMQHEGITMDRAGVIYIVNENGGGDINYPQLWVYAPTNMANEAPTAVSLNNAVNSIQENSSTVTPLKLGDIVVTDDGLGTNELSLSGADVASFEISGTALYLKAGVDLDYETKNSYAVTINVDDTTVGTTPDVTVDFTLTVTDQVVETPAVAAIVITEVAPWSSGNSPLAADWFELTNVSDNPVTITGWKVDDNSASFGNSLELQGIATIAAGESVVFVEGSATTANSLKSNWFGANPPVGLQVGYYTGSGIGLGTSGDEVNIYNAGGTLQASVSFGASDSVSPYQTFDNTIAANNTTVSLLSEVGVNGAFVAANSSIEIGSPGYSAPGVLRITEVAPWSSGNSPVAADWFEVTNTGARPVGIEGWKFDDVSESFAGGSYLTGITSIAPGESVVFIQTADLASTSATFLNVWFGANPPAGLKIGAHTGDGLGTSGDAVNLFDSNGARKAKVTFSTSPSAAPFGTFDNTAGMDAAAVTLKSVVGVNGAFVAANDANEVGSPGLVVSEGPQDFALWLSAKGYSSFGFGADTDNDGITDGVEFFFNQNPNNASGSSNMPQLFPNAGALELDFTRLTDTGDISGELQVSCDLADWMPALSGVDYTVASEVVNGDETSFTYALPGSGPSAPGVSPTYPSPNESTPAGGSLGGLRIVNEGLVGVGRISGGAEDEFGETQGAASGLFITDWAWTGSEFTGKFQVLPDRGFNSGSIYSNYAARLHRVDFTFTPFYGAGPVAQNQILPTYVESSKFTYQDGATTKFTTGLDVAGTGTLFGQSVGVVTAANGPGGAQESLLALDAEAVHLFDDGSGFVSDEYGTYIARFNAAKQITGITQLPESARPHSALGVLGFSSTVTPLSGRRQNQGLEGMSVTPDGTRLFALMQSALVQDTDGSNQQTRNNTRLFVYDVEGANRENPVLVGEHVVKLPQFNSTGSGGALNRTAAQSEIVALNGSSFLMLPRDGNGLGTGTTTPIVFKSVQLVDFASATNILGVYDAEGESISPGGVLAAGVNAAASTEIINMLTADLAKFGLNANTNPADANTLNEKMEGMALVPDLSTPQENDFFLFLANDNDFQSPDVKMIDAAGNLVSYGDGRLNAGITNDAMFYAFRITIDACEKRFYRFGVE